MAMKKLIAKTLTMIFKTTEITPTKNAADSKIIVQTNISDVFDEILLSIMTVMCKITNIKFNISVLVMHYLKGKKKVARHISKFYSVLTLLCVFMSQNHGFQKL